MRRMMMPCDQYIDPPPECGGGGDPPPPSEPPPPSGERIEIGPNCAEVTNYNDLGGVNLVEQHGIHSNACAWDRMDRWLTGTYATDQRVRASLPSVDRLASQAGQLGATIGQYNGGRAGYVFLGHSQGGLISRSLAQSWQDAGRGDLVRGVITMHTPNHGAPIVKMGRGFLLGGVAGAVLTQTGCEILLHRGCLFRGLLFGAAVTGMLGEIAYDYRNDDAGRDLRPGSVFLSSTNSHPEYFNRYGIVGLAQRRWTLFRLAGDWKCQPDAWCGGRAMAGYAKNTYRGFLGCSVVGMFTLRWHRAGACAVSAAGMLGFDYLWQRFYSPGDGTGDGIVPGRSQPYPNALEQFEVRDADSHVGATSSSYSMRRVQTILSDRLGVPTKATNVPF